MGASIEDLIGRVKSPVRSVTLCLDADLQAEWDQLNERLEQIRREQIGRKMGDSSEARDVAERVRALEKEMRAAEAVFTFKGLSSFGLTKLMDRFPARKGKQEQWDITSGAAALVAAASVEPKMTEDDAGRLLEVLSYGQTDSLVTAAWLASTETKAVPFSVRASAVLDGNG